MCRFKRKVYNKYIVFLSKIFWVKSITRPSAHPLKVTRERDFDVSRDNLYVNFYFGPNPSVPKRTRVVLPVTMQVGPEGLV